MHYFKVLVYVNSRGSAESQELHLKSRMSVEERARIVSWQIYEDTDNCKIERDTRGR